MTADEARWCDRSSPPAQISTPATRHPNLRPCHPAVAAPKTRQGHPAKLPKRMSRRWRVVLLRAKGEILGTVEAPDVAAAKAPAAIQFELDDVQRNRIMAQELG